MAKKKQKPIKAEIVQGKTLGTMLGDVFEAQIKAKQEFESSGGMCLHCKKEKGDDRPNPINPFHCRKCNDETEKLLEQLRKSPGFMAFKIGG